MPDQNSLQHRQELDDTIQRLLEHLNTADQELETARAAINNYVAAHPDNHPSGHAIADSLNNIHRLIQTYNNEHNQIVGMLQAAREEAQNRADDGSPY